MRWVWFLRSSYPRVHVQDNKKEINTIKFNFDDGITRKAFDMSALLSTSHLPRSIYCPITNMPMVDPVIATDGNSYERESIVKWFGKNKTSPCTGNKIDHSILIPNHNLRNTISEIMNA